jgi:hypothetical protein
MKPTHPAPHPADALNGARVKRLGSSTILIALPPHLWRSSGRCDCSHCNGRPAFWDAVAVAAKPAEGRADTTWTVHAPELTGSARYLETAAQLRVTCEDGCGSYDQRRLEGASWPPYCCGACGSSRIALAPLFPAE